MKIKIDEAGRIIIPKAIRELLKINVPDELELKIENDRLILKRAS